MVGGIVTWLYNKEPELTCDEKGCDDYPEGIFIDTAEIPTKAHMIEFLGEDPSLGFSPTKARVLEMQGGVPNPLQGFFNTQSIYFRQPGQIGQNNIVGRIHHMFSNYCALAVRYLSESFQSDTIANLQHMISQLDPMIERFQRILSEVKEVGTYDHQGELFETRHLASMEATLASYHEIMSKSVEAGIRKDYPGQDQWEGRKDKEAQERLQEVSSLEGQKAQERRHIEVSSLEWQEAQERRRKAEENKKDEDFQVMEMDQKDKEDFEPLFIKYQKLLPRIQRADYISPRTGTYSARLLLERKRKSYARAMNDQHRDTFAPSPLLVPGEI